MKVFSGMALLSLRLATRAKRIHERLRHIADYCEASAHVAIEGAVAYCDFALVAGGQHQGAGFVG